MLELLHGCRICCRLKAGRFRVTHVETTPTVGFWDVTVEIELPNDQQDMSLSVEIKSKSYYLRAISNNVIDVNLYLNKKISQGERGWLATKFETWKSSQA